MSVQIPKTFSLMNRDYDVVKANGDEQKAMDEHSEGRILGLCDTEESRIIMGTHKRRDAFEHTYFHELTHGLFEAVGRQDLSEDEALVDAIGGALHQYEKTKKGRLPLR